MNVWRAGPAVFARFAVPASKTHIRKTFQKCLNLCRCQAPNTDVDRACVRLPLKHSVRVVNVAGSRRMINTLCDPVRRLQPAQGRECPGMETVIVCWIQRTTNFGRPWILRGRLRSARRRGSTARLRYRWKSTGRRDPGDHADEECNQENQNRLPGWRESAEKLHNSRSC